MKFIAAMLLLLSFESKANSCAGDAKKFCHGIEPGKGQLARCLSDYEGQLTKACADELKSFKKDTGAKNPCFEDLAEFCADVPAFPENIEYCLLKNESRLGPKCSADFKKKKGNIIVRNVCAQDVASNCYSEISAPEGAINRCLIRNKAKLSPFCKNKVEKKILDLRKKNHCFDDTEKFCPTQIKFIDIQDCLNKKLPSLAPNCKKLVEAENIKMKSNPCYRDLITHCKMGISPADQHRCLTVNENELSNACRQFRANEESKVNKMVNLCEQDRLKLCPKAPFKDGQVVKCLRQNKTKVSPACQQLL